MQARDTEVLHVDDAVVVVVLAAVVFLVVCLLSSLFGLDWFDLFACLVGCLVV